MSTKYSRKQPNLGRNEKLAGKTVYSHGMNVTYDGLGYVVKAINVNHEGFAGTTMSVRAQPIEDALAGKPWTPPDTAGLREWDYGADPEGAGTPDGGD